MSDLPQAFQDAVSGPRFGWCELLRIDFPSLLLATTTHERPVEQGGVSYQPDGRWGGIQGVKITDSLRPPRTTIILSGVDDAILTQLRDEYTPWARIRVWWCALDPETFDVAGEPVPAGEWRAGKTNIRIGPDKAEVEISAEGMGIRLFRPSMLSASSATQQQRFPGDKFFDLVPEIPGTEIRWARTLTTLSGGGYLRRGDGPWDQSPGRITFGAPRHWRQS